MYVFYCIPNAWSSRGPNFSAHFDRCGFDRDSLEFYFAEGEDVLADDPLDDPGDEDLDDEAPSVPSRRSDLIELLKRVDPTEFGFALDGCKSCGGYDDFVAAIRSRAFLLEFTASSRDFK